MKPVKKRNRSGYAVASEIKRSDGLSVGEIAERLGLSYMGIKARCLALEKSGHVTSRNQHCGSGRPRLIYRLTAKGQRLFQQDDNGLAVSLLQEAQSLFGPPAAEKLLFRHFQKRAEEHLKQLPAKPSPEERLEAFAAQREAGGHMAKVQDGCLVEAHVPLAGLFKAFPAALAMEEAMVSKVLGFPVRRAEERSGEHCRIRFEAFRCGTSVA